MWASAFDCLPFELVAAAVASWDPDEDMHQSAEASNEQESVVEVDVAAAGASLIVGPFVDWAHVGCKFRPE